MQAGDTDPDDDSGSKSGRSVHRTTEELEEETCDLQRGIVVRMKAILESTGIAFVDSCQSRQQRLRLTIQHLRVPGRLAASQRIEEKERSQQHVKVTGTQTPQRN